MNTGRNANMMTTLEQIAKELRITHQAVSQIEKRALLKLQKALIEKGYDVLDLHTHDLELISHVYFKEHLIDDDGNIVSRKALS